MKRLALVIITATGCALAASILGSGNAPVARARSSARTLNITTKTVTLTAPSTPPAAGDRFVFYETVSGGETGRDYADCVVTNARGEALCHLVFVLKRGAIGIDAVANLNDATLHGTGPILGGTGRYNGARGTVVYSGPAENTRFSFRFLSH